MLDRPTGDRRDDEGLNDDDYLADEEVARLDPDEISDRPGNLDVNGITPLPEELTGRASGTDEDLVALFGNRTDQHMADGFRGGSEDEPPADDDEFEQDPTQTMP